MDINAYRIGPTEHTPTSLGPSARQDFIGPREPILRLPGTSSLTDRAAFDLPNACHLATHRLNAVTQDCLAGAPMAKVAVGELPDLAKFEDVDRALARSEGIERFHVDGGRGQEPDSGQARQLQ